MLPELSFYEEGDAPKLGRYNIDVVENDVVFSVQWTDDSGDHEISFGGPLDGQLYPTDLAPNSFTSFTQIDDSTLESAVVMNDVEVAYARRQASIDGDLLAVLQVNRKPDGSIVRITQVYRRDS
ncbi:MAG: hypothetical protein AAGH17_06665 [Pseudomonadota bacterium]